MQNSSNGGTRRGLLLSIFVLGLVTAFIVLPSRFVSEAVSRGEGLVERTSSHSDELPNYDIREQKGEEVDSFFVRARQSVGKDASAVATTREDFVRGEEDLRTRVPSLKIEYNNDIRIPEVITPDVWKARMELLSSPSGAKRSEILRGFVKENNSLIGVSDAQADSLAVTSDYTNPDGQMSFAHLEQRINNVPVFRGEVKAGFTKNGEIIRVINNLAPGLDYESLSTDFRNPLDAVKAAARHIGNDMSKLDLNRNETESTDLRTVYGRGDWATVADKMYFPTEPGIAVAAWRVIIWQPVNAFMILVDAETGTMLWRKNLTEDQTQAATYQIYRNANSFLGAHDSPAPLSPGPLDPATGTQGALLTRTNVTLIGNEAPYTFNNNGWITDGANITDGNANEAGIDRDGTNGVDAPQTGSPNRVFDSTWNPPPGNPAPGDEPLTPQAQRGAVIQMFYIMNRYHDELYRVGFTEPAFNFQNDNFGRGGVGADRVSSEGQDSSGTNNANFSTPPDGGRGRMQMFLWTGPTPDYDGTPDAEVVIHEVTHGTSNRLHGNAAGLSTNMARGMGEGWSDWYSYTLLAQPTDPINGVYTTGGYATYLITAGFTANYYYGIRRYPRAPITFTGGPNNKPHNAFTFRDINADCNTRLNNTVFAFARGPIGVTQCDQVHNIGEIWSSALWEVRNRMVTRLGFTPGTTKALQVVTDGMKLAPVGPTLLQERDAIIAGAVATGTAADVQDIREGFRVRGMGFSASIQSQAPAAVTEAFDAPELGGGGPATVTSGNNLLEPNECNTLNVPIINNSPNPASGITATLSTTTPGITVTQATSAYPNLAAGASATNTTPFQVSLANTVACFTSANFTLTISFTGGGGGSPVTTNFSLPVGIPGGTYTFASGTGATIPAGGVLVAGSQADDAAVALTLPSGWTSTLYDVPVTSLSASTNGLVTANAATATTFGNTALPAAAGGTNPTIVGLWDDMVLDTVNVTGGGIYTNTIGSAPNRQFIIEWRAQHFAETVNGAITINYAVVLNEGSSQVQYRYVLTGIAPNQNGVSATVGIQRQATGTSFTQHSFNQAVIMPGMTLTGTLPAGQCTPGSGPCGPVVPTNPKRADFDDDGRSDLSVYRPGSTGTWYHQNSGGGFGAVNWGTTGDQLAPGDFDGDGQTDYAVYRPVDAANQPDVHILNSETFTYTGIPWGLTGDIAVFGDYTNDDRTDVAVFRPSTNTWFLRNPNDTAQIVTLGSSGDLPLTGDFNGNGRSDFALFRPSNGTWYYADPTTPATFTAIAFGQNGDRPVHADYDGDGTDDIAVFRGGTWYIRNSNGGSVTVQSFGLASDVPVPGDYDGDGRYDVSVFRNGTWFVNRSNGSGVLVSTFGTTGDVAIPSEYIQ